MLGLRKNTQFPVNRESLFLIYLFSFKYIIKYDKNAKVVIVTGYSEFNVNNTKALEQGLISIITKPIGIDELLDLAKKYCSKEIPENRKSTSNSNLERSIS